MLVGTVHRTAPMGESEPDWRGQLTKAFGVNRPYPFGIVDRSLRKPIWPVDKKRAEFYRRHAPVITSGNPSALRFLGSVVALRFELRVLIGRENGFRLFHEPGTTLLRATAFHAFSLPRFQLRFLIGRDVEARKRHAVRFAVT